MQKGDVLIPREDGGEPTHFRRKVIRQQEVIEVVDKKVKTFTKKLVPCTFEKQIKVNRFVEKQIFEEEEETYVDYEEKVEPREVQVWVELAETEEYTEKIPVQLYKDVRIPITSIIEEEGTVEVEVDNYDEEEVQGWRIDEVEDIKIVEIEEWEIYELAPEKTDEVQTGEVRDLGFVSAPAKRVYGPVYKVTEEEKAKDDGIDLASLEIDGDVDVTAFAMFHGDRAVAALYKHNDPSQGQYDEVDWQVSEKKGPVQDSSAQQSMGVPDDDDEDDFEPFNLEKCLEYTRKSLKSQNCDGLDVDEFVEQLESRWRFVDSDQGGLVELDELRLAVWQTEEDNAGVPMPQGKFRKELQDIVDEIWVGCGSKAAFTIWDFVKFMLDEQLLENVTVKTPPQRDTWAHAIPSDQF